VRYRPINSRFYLLTYKKGVYKVPPFKYNVLYSMPAAGKLSVGDSVPAAAKLA